uniref:Putative ovule protein n=1 Tax=Solanum chacoense TaxID=4108 RepID=A0A0V0H8U9_SOLCH
MTPLGLSLGFYFKLYTKEIEEKLSVRLSSSVGLLLNSHLVGEGMIPHLVIPSPFPLPYPNLFN